MGECTSKNKNQEDTTPRAVTANTAKMAGAGMTETESKQRRRKRQSLPTMVRMEV